VTDQQAPQVLGLLAEVRRLRQEADQVDVQLRWAVKAAKAADAEVTAIADAAGKGRPTIYRWLAEDATLTVDVGEVLDDALVHLAKHVSAGTAAQVLRGVGHADVQVRLWRYRLGVTNLPPGGVDGELRAVLMLASQVIDAAGRIAADHGGRWPSTVTVH
jgi:hypothetical protein